MMDTKQIKTENKKLKKQLSKGNLKFYKKIEYFIHSHDLTIEQLHRIRNQILVDFTDRQNKGEILNRSILNPQEYVEKILSNFEVKNTSFLLTSFRRYTPLLLIIVCLIILYNNSKSPQFYTNTNPDLVEIETKTIFLVFINFLVFGYLINDDKDKLFKIKLSTNIKTLIILIDYLFFMLLMDRYSYMFFTNIVMPKIYIYFVLGLSIIFMFINRKKVWL